MVPLIPPGKSGGGKRTVIMREVVNGLMYVLSGIHTDLERLGVSGTGQRTGRDATTRKSCHRKPTQRGFCRVLFM
jgi:hypothetical protein